MLVRIPSPLRSYTNQSSEVQAHGQTLGEVLVNLNEQSPGIRFRMIDEQGRIREHIKFFINTSAVNDLQAAVHESDTVHIICALSGG